MTLKKVIFAALTIVGLIAGGIGLSHFLQKQYAEIPEESFDD